MKKGVLIIAGVVIILLVVGIILYFFVIKNPEYGKYYSDNGNLLGKCLIIKSQGAGNDVTKFYDLDNNFIGSCWFYHGPGSSGGNKQGCDNDALLSDPWEGVRNTKYACLYENVTRDDLIKIELINRLKYATIYPNFDFEYYSRSSSTMQGDSEINLSGKYIDNNLMFVKGIQIKGRGGCYILDYEESNKLSNSCSIINYSCNNTEECKDTDRSGSDIYDYFNNYYILSSLNSSIYNYSIKQLSDNNMFSCYIFISWWKEVNAFSFSKNYSICFNDKNEMILNETYDSDTPGGGSRKYYIMSPVYN